MMCTALCVAALSAMPSTAHAQDGKPASTESDKLSDQAFEAYKRGAYAEAIALYTKAYQASPDGAIIFNIARIYETKLNDQMLAMEYYRRYLYAPDADAELVKRANERLTALKAQVDAQSVMKNQKPAPQTAQPATGAPPPGADTAEPQKSTAVRTIGLVTGAIGIVGLGVGTVAGIMAVNKNNDAGSLCNGNACRSQDALTLTSDARSAASVSTVSFIAGGALLAAGAALFLFAPTVGPAKTGTVAPLVDRQTAGLSFTMGW
jgi:tetratricopeptide (TPR) repeat protein